MDAMINPTPQPNAANGGSCRSKASEQAAFHRSAVPDQEIGNVLSDGRTPSLEAGRGNATRNREALAVIERTIPTPSQRKSRTKPPLPKNSLLKRLDTRYWRRKLRYFYVRFLRMQSSPEALARGVAAGVFAGAFPLLGFQTLIGIMIAALVRGNKMAAAAGTWISNPLTYFPIFALNFHLGRLLLRFPKETILPTGTGSMDEWMSLGISATAALLVGALVVGAIAAVIGYYISLVVARRVRKARRSL